MSDEITIDEVKSDCAFKFRVVDEGFSVREPIKAGTKLFDPMTGWFDDDGTLVYSDHGPQLDPDHWDPDKGHGGIHRLFPDDHSEVILTPGLFSGMPFNIRKAPPHFGKHAGDIFFTGQSVAGRQGARSPHHVYRMVIGEDLPSVFGEIPHAGKLNDGVPGALMIGGFAPKGSSEEGYYLCNSMVNCVVYRVDGDGNVEPWLFLDTPDLPFMIQPYFVFWAGPHWGEFEGQLMISGRSNSNYLDSAPGTMENEYFVVEDGKVNTTAIRTEDMGLAMAEIAPPEFGPYGGQAFWVHHGSLNLMHKTKSPERGPLPYDCQIFRIDHEGNQHLFADGIQGGWNEIRFHKNRMLMSLLRRSYSTGEYHLPDGSMYEVLALD